LGLEAAKATHDLGLKTHVIEFASRLMPRQLDDAGSKMLVDRIEAMGVDVHLNRQTEEIFGGHQVEGLRFTDGSRIDADMVVVSAGIRARDELARDCGLTIGERGGVTIDDELRTSDPHIYAVGEVALHRNMIYGLVAPGYEMAETLAANLCGGGQQVFKGGDLSAKLKLMGVDVASFGDHEAAADTVCPLTHEDPFTGVYRKLLFSRDGRNLIGGMLVGDASDYGVLQALCRSDDELPAPPGELLSGAGAALGGADALPDDAQVCSCNRVSKGQICEAISREKLRSVAEVKTCTQAGSGCGGCLPLVTDIFKQELEKAGVTLVNHLCEHFRFSRQELFQIIKIKEYRSFDDVLRHEGCGSGCEICKPAVASILDSLWNECVVDHDTIQDTNDRFLA
ncbi:MAG: FAD-dependent oxidoreductase, partial [Verrucomicrobiota bacterium]